MTRGLLLVADGVDETHLDYAYHRLREDAVLVDVAAPGGGPVRTAGGKRRESVAVDSIPADRRYDVVVVPGGDSPTAVGRDEGCRGWVRRQLDTDGVICTIGDGIRVLLATGDLDDRLVAAPDSLVERLLEAGARPTEEAVTVDGSIVTVRGTEALAYGIAAALGNAVIRQDHTDAARERPAWPDANRLDPAGR